MEFLLVLFYILFGLMTFFTILDIKSVDMKIEVGVCIALGLLWPAFWGVRILAKVAR